MSNYSDFRNANIKKNVGKLRLIVCNAIYVVLSQSNLSQNDHLFEQYVSDYGH